MISKKKNNILQIIFIIFIVMCIFTFFSISFNSFAYSATDIYNKPSDANQITDRAGQILWIITIIGILIGAGMIAYIGVKYIVASPDGKAEIKKQAFGYLLGAFLLISGGLAVQIIVNIADSLNSISS